MLLRRLWPNWQPTDEQITEIWCRSFDKPHAAKGEKTVNQKALKIAICNANRTSKWKEPNFLDISDAYRREQNYVLSEIDRMSMTDDTFQEKAAVKSEHEARLREFETWPTERLQMALEYVGRKFPSWKNKSLNITGWSQMLTGLVWAADLHFQGKLETKDDKK